MDPRWLDFCSAVCHAMSWLMLCINFDFLHLHSDDIIQVHQGSCLLGWQDDELIVWVSQPSGGSSRVGELSLHQYGIFDLAVAHNK